MRRDRDGRGMTLIELLVVVTILMVIAAVAVPTVKFAVKRQKELDLRRALRVVRRGVDEYKKLCDAGVIQKTGVDSECYPEDLDVLVKGVEKTGALGQKVKFLRKIPVDPMTNSFEWGIRSYQDEPDSESWGRQNVYDIYTTAGGKALDGTNYKDW